MTSAILQNVWYLWKNKLITKRKVTEIIKHFGYELSYINDSGIMIIDGTTKRSYTPPSYIETPKKSLKDRILSSITNLF